MSFLPRCQLIELHDLESTPRFLRDYVTEGLRTYYLVFWYYLNYIPSLVDALKKTGTTHIVDLCVGAGGPLPAIQNAAHKQGHTFSITQTDLYPNVHGMKITREDYINKGTPAHLLKYSEAPVDATKCTQPGFRTLIGSFHHFPPALATKILQDAVDTGSGIAIYESCQRDLFNLFFFAFITPIMYALLAPFIKPFSWGRLFFTYIIPVVPAINGIDGFVSCMRTYSEHDFRELLKNVKGAEGYTWDIGVERIWLGTNLMHYIGYPKQKTR